MNDMCDARAFIGKGLVKVNNFRRRDNKWAYAYLLTPKGVQYKKVHHLGRQW